jgi:hypothetical protein
LNPDWKSLEWELPSLKSLFFSPEHGFESFHPGLLESIASGATRVTNPKTHPDLPISAKKITICFLKKVVIKKP